MKLHKLPGWTEIAHKLKGLYKPEQNPHGSPGPDAPSSMFKLLLLPMAWAIGYAARTYPEGPKVGLHRIRGL